VKYLFQFFFILFSLSEARVKVTGNNSVYYHKTGNIVVSGNAKVINKKSTLTAKKIKYHKLKKNAQAIGNVKFNNSLHYIAGAAGEMNYNMRKDIITLHDNPSVTNIRDHITFRADTILSDQKKNIVYGYSNVIVTDGTAADKMTTYSDISIYQNDISLLILSNNSKVKTETSVADCSYIHYYKNKEETWLYDNVSIYSWEKDNTSRTNIIKANKIKYTGRSNVKTYECYSNVSLYNAEEDTTIYAQYARFNPSTSYSYITGKPKLASQNNDIIIEALSFERFDNHQKMSAKGEVIITVKDGTSTKKVYGSIADFYMKDGKTIIYGNPYIADNNNRFYAEKITIMNESKKMYMTRQVQGDINEIINTEKEN
jgi:lipopolysaccharide export system protein LptA